MSSTFSPRESSSRNWWPISKSSSNPSFHSEKSSQRDHSTKKSDGSKFNTIASAIGLSKSKKHPSLTIQNPPPAILTAKSQGEPLYSPRTPPVYASRPPSKSVSSTKSRVDSLEPRTPSDSRDSGSHRHSLLTLSDPDPFAARNFSLTSPEDPNRLSAYSGSSNPDYLIQPKTLDRQHQFNRTSYASSSSQSNSNHTEDLSVLSGSSWISELPHHPHSKPPGTSSSDDDISLNDPLWDNLLDPPGMSNLLKSGSSSTLTDHNRLSHPDPARSRSTRPHMRARGMTVGTLSQRSKFLQDEKEPRLPSPQRPPSSFNHHDPVSPTSPRVVVRQPSIQRMGMPATAPPSQKLPPPPPTNAPTEDRSTTSRRSLRDSTSSALSSLSRDTGMNNQHYIPRNKARERVLMPSQPAEEHLESLSPKSTPQNLKRAVSQQSLKASSSLSKPEPPAGEKVPRKQRSFHHPRIPLPPMPMPLRHASSFTNADGSQTIEAKRDSASGPSTPVRKRLFSGSSMRRPSTSTSIAPEDDARSIFSISAEHDRSQRKSSTPAQTNPPAQQPLQVSSFWDEGDVPHSPQASVMDYTPKQIMSPAEMLKLEADVQAMEVSRSRGLSITSTTTSIASESEYDYAPSIASVASQSLFGGSLRPNPPGPVVRSHSMVIGGDVDDEMKGYSMKGYSKSRPSTSQGAASGRPGSKSGPTSSPFSSPSPPPGFVSLPPPPRPRRTTTTSVASLGRRTEEPAMVSLSPPPRSKSVKSTRSTSSTQAASTAAPPVTATRRPIMKKPSFLHIDDEVPRNSHSSHSHTRTAKPSEPRPSHVQKVLQHEDSFLDFARDSIDTLRSDE
ncbi:hypothetical protein AAF712_000653 [Marasmius tenuissimus]|uniref:Uncharacterized protein n=1 Tax=Marasmius tenuissimus TaxID=585030 RepID=A0ABR3AEB5_9AGAR